MRDEGKPWMSPPVHQMPSENGYGGREYGGQQQAPDESVAGNGGIVQQQLPANYKPPGYQWNNYQANIYEQNSNKIANADAMHGPTIYDRMLIYLS